ncbi:MAG: hypothetical protein PHF44_00905 [Candidatus Pacebacteria bacterium]|nr:hypothetical protein [Candidatus Paceibacterota bacterium]
MRNYKKNIINHNRTLTLPFPIASEAEFKFNFRFFWAFFSLLIVSLLIFYVFQINNLISQTYLLQNYQKRIEKLNQEKEELEGNLAGVGSLYNVENLIGELKLEKINQISYIQISENPVATAKQ